MSPIVGRFIIILIVVPFAWPSVGLSGGLEKRSRLEFRFGLWQQKHDSRQIRQIGSFGVETIVDNGGTMGALSYAYWVRENVSVNFTLGFLAVEATSQASLLGISQNTVNVFPVLVGVRYYFTAPSPEAFFRPYLAAGAGPFIGYEAKNEVGFRVLQTSRTLTAFGSHLGGGVDIQLSRHFMLGANAGYNLMMDFSEPLGGRGNYSGPEFGVGISWLFGKGIE